MTALEKAIEEARPMLDWPADWDEQGSPPISPAAFARAEAVLLEADRILGGRLPIPRITAGPDGGVDLHWIIERRELLIGVPIAGAPAYYGDDRNGGERHKGLLLSMGGERDRELFSWLAEG